MQRSTFLALSLRILIALSTRTFFQPDEYFQSLEPAHRIVFGYGHLTWEWLIPAPVRSPLYSLLNVPVYWIIKVLHWDDYWILIAGPKVLHGALAALTDISIRKITKNALGKRYVSTAFFLSLTSFFHALSLSRSLSNSLETSLTAVALAYYPWNASAPRRSEMRSLLVSAALACAVRPTNAIIWVYLLGALLWRLRSSQYPIRMLAIDALVVGSLAVTAVFFIDTVYYNAPTFTPLNFLRTNLSHVSLFYGASPIHYYITQALPILCMAALPFVLRGMWTATTSQTGTYTMLGCILWTIAVYSTTGHKEWRFLHPLVPLMHVLASQSLVDGYTAESKQKSTLSRPFIPVPRRHLVMLLLNIPPMLYIILFHDSAPIAAIDCLRALPASEVRSLGILAPCHSTPGHAYLHRPHLANAGRMWALGCEPPLWTTNVTGYRDQTDVFFADPVVYLEQHFPLVVDPTFPPSPRAFTPPGTMPMAEDWWHEWPEVLVMFAALLEDENSAVRYLLERKGYSEVWRAGWAWQGEGRTKGGMRIWRYV